MAESYFISGLKQQRAESLGELEDLRKNLADLDVVETKLLDLIGPIDAPIQHEDSNFQLDSIKLRKSMVAHMRKGMECLVITAISCWLCTKLCARAAKALCCLALRMS